MNVISSRTDNIKTEDRRIGLTITFQPFINEHVLVDITSVSIPVNFLFLNMHIYFSFP